MFFLCVHTQINYENTLRIVKMVQINTNILIPKW